MCVAGLHVWLARTLLRADTVPELDDLFGGLLDEDFTDYRFFCAVDVGDRWDRQRVPTR